MKKKYLIVSGIFIMVVIGMVSFSLYQSSQLPRDTEAKPQQEKPHESVDVPEEPKRLTPDRPEDYGMTVTPENNKPRTQEEWNNLIAEKMSGLRYNTDPEAWERVKTMTAEDPARTQEKIRQIEADIARYEEILVSDPSNQDLSNKIERLRMLKAIAEEFLKKL